MPDSVYTGGKIVGFVVTSLVVAVGPFFAITAGLPIIGVLLMPITMVSKPPDSATAAAALTRTALRFGTHSAGFCGAAPGICRCRTA